MKQKIPTEVVATIIKNIVNIYNERGFENESQAAKQCGMLQETFHNYCKGKIPKAFFELIKISKGFHVSADQILGLESEQDRKQALLITLATHLLLAYENREKKGIVTSVLTVIFGDRSENIIKLLDDLLESKHSPPRKLLVTEVAKKNSKQAA